ncbi:hypothetical protein N7465_010571 [Penicillium sp. CMV-2018d]|nr:hypothetical protein N7465_010571 [Penicillium sp. CMV-2018d]
MSPDIEASHRIHDEVIADAGNVLTAFASTLFLAHHLLASPRRTSIFGFTVLEIAKSTAIEPPCLSCSFGLSIEFNQWDFSPQWHWKKPWMVWLCGDLGAQFLFSSNDVKDEEIKSSTQRGETQKNLPSSQGYDPRRTARHLTVGIVASIPSYKWFMFLHRRFNFASSIASLATKVVVQQAVFTPVFNTYFFTMQSLLSGASVEDTLVRLQLALPTSIANGVKVWTGVAIISFMYVPPQFRSVFSGCIAVAWQTYLSWMNQNVRSAH